MDSLKHTIVEMEVRYSFNKLKSSITPFECNMFDHKANDMFILSKKQHNNKSKAIFKYSPLLQSINLRYIPQIMLQEMSKLLKSSFP